MRNKNKIKVLENRLEILQEKIDTLTNKTETFDFYMKLDNNKFLTNIKVDNNYKLCISVKFLSNDKTSIIEKILPLYISESYKVTGDYIEIYDETLSTKLDRVFRVDIGKGSVLEVDKTWYEEKYAERLTKNNIKENCYE